MPTRFILNPPVDIQTFEENLTLPENLDHRVLRVDRDDVVDAVTLDTDSDSDILAFEAVLRTSLQVTPTVERNVGLEEV